MSENQKQSQINYKWLILNLSLCAFAIFLLYEAFQSLQENKREAHYDSSIYIQYDNVYQLLSAIYHKPGEDSHFWETELIKLSLENILKFCDIVEINDLDPKTDASILETDLLPEGVRSEFNAVVTAVTEFECSKTPDGQSSPYYTSGTFDLTETLN